ncbi:MAG: GspH/FimT family pseudopilin [Candidatus Accumulibacter sp.]|jgi:type IV fimbrial biogenesis protein FimT|nr:GspH/FimT family pseudopilin [Accumulibacter sp.]
MLKFSRGVTLIELAVGILILSILIAMAAPNFSTWIRNMRIRTVAESVLSGLQLARAEALKENSRVSFQLMDGDGASSASGPNWVVSRADGAGDPVQAYDGAEGGGDKALIAAEEETFTFNGLGRLASTPANILVSSSDGATACADSGGKVRCMRIEVSAGGSIRMCDPALPSTDPQGCS